MRFRTFFIFCLSILFIIPLLTRAQNNDGGIVNPDNISKDISFIVQPETPGPNTPVSISIESSGTDLNSSIITWSVNGKTVKTGLGIKTINITTGQTGSDSNIKVSVDSTNGPFSESLTISPNEVDLLWQGKGYVPPFYKGLTLWSTQGPITLVAIPHVLNQDGKMINSSSLIYKWSKDGTVLGSASGAGKNSLNLYDSILSLPQTIRVDVSVDYSTFVASAEINLTPVNPRLLVYENNPLYGPLFNREVGNKISLINKEVSLIALPLFFSPTNRNSSTLDYNWFVNGISTGQTTSQTTYRSPDSGVGSSNISVKLTNKNKVSQTAEKSFGVEFGKQNNF